MKDFTLPLNDSGTARLRCCLHEPGSVMSADPLPVMLVCPDSV